MTPEQLQEIKDFFINCGYTIKLTTDEATAFIAEKGCAFLVCKWCALPRFYQGMKEGLV